MIFFKDLSDLTFEEKQKFIEWKSNVELCDLIMSEPVNIDNDQLDFWIETNSNDPNQYFKSVHRTSDNKLIGLVRLMFIDKESRIAEVGLYIGDLVNRRGKFGTVMLQHLIQVANEQYGLNKVYAKIKSDNISSISLFEKNNFVSEGRLREHYFSRIDNKFIDVLILSKFISL